MKHLIVYITIKLWYKQLQLKLQLAQLRAPPSFNFPPAKENLPPLNEEAQQNSPRATIFRWHMHMQCTSCKKKEQTCGGPKNGAEPPNSHKCPHKVNTTEMFPDRFYTTNTHFNDAGILMDASAAPGGLLASQMWSAVTLNAARLIQTFSASWPSLLPAAGGCHWLKGPLSNGDGGHWTLELTH